MDNKIVLIIGTRPEIIKVALLANKLRYKLGENFQLWDTGQHYDYNLDKIFYDEMGIISPDINFNVQSGTTAEQISRIMEATEKNLMEFKPTKVIVVGDTNSTFGSAFITKRCGIKLAHIEAGPREYFVQYINGKPCFHKSPAMLNMPENLNRILIDNMSDYLFAPTPMSYDNLVREKLYGQKYFTGDIQNDVIKYHLSRIKKLPFYKRDFTLLTLHRAENTDYKTVLIRIMNAFIESDKDILFPMHPRTKKRLQDIHKWNDVRKADNIYICEPMGFFDFMNALVQCDKVFTDSGGVQKEAYLLGKPCVTMRPTCGWIDVVLSGANKIVGSNKQLITEELNSPIKTINNSDNIFGNGKATDKIIKYLVK
jgi:UDP-N-acetylglucosamine 2-epimerase (non-hydrolysing)